MTAALLACGRSKGTPPPVPLAISTNSLPPGEVGIAYSQIVTSTGGAAPVHFAVAAGSALPGGLALEAATGRIAGIPTIAGTFALTLTAADSAGETATRALSGFVVAPAPSLNATAIPDSEVGVAYAVALSATGGTPPFSFALAAGSTLPAGLGLGRTAGVISGIPVAADAASFTVLATDAAGGIASQAYALTVHAALAIVAATPADGRVGLAYTQSFSTTGGAGAIRFALAAGSQAPTGLSLDAALGSLAGTPALEGTSTFTLSATDGLGAVATRDFTLVIAAAQAPLPPDPVTVATQLDVTVATDIADATGFLYLGANPIQTGVAPGTIERRRAGVLRGRVTAASGTPLGGVRITVLGHGEFGQTLTRADGAFDLAVNGGGSLTVRYEKEGFLPSQRALVAGFRDYAWLPEVVMIPFDTAVTPVDLGAAAMQVARANAVSDADGARRATLLFPRGTTATMLLPDGSLQPLSALHVRATEYTVGAAGPKAMPAALPPSSGYTYAAELSVDEAVAAGASEVRFNRALPFYLENFLGFPVGTAVPTGYYDRQKGQWIASANGRVIKVLGVASGLAVLDTDGNGVADDAATLAALAINDEERQQLAQLYAPGQTLWRVPVTHFSAWDCNWPYGPPPDAVPPPDPDAIDPPVDDDCIQLGSVLGCENQSLGESVPVSGTPWRLHYRSQRTPGRKDAYTLSIPVSGAGGLPATVRGFRVEVSVAGRIYHATFAPAPNLRHTVTWDGNDAYGRPVQGTQTATVRVSYDYQPQYYATLSGLLNSFARAEATGGELTANRAASLVALSKSWTARLGTWRAGMGLGGWSLSVQHAYDPSSRTLFLGDGSQRRADALPPVIVTVAGNGTPGIAGEGGPATAAQLSLPTGVAVGPDGTLYIDDSTQNRIRRVGPDGIITTIAGTGVAGVTGDGGPATEAQLDFPRSVSLGPDGSLYFVDYHNNRVRRVGPDGTIATVAGTGVRGFSGDGGPAALAQLAPWGVTAAPDGSLFISDLGNNRLRRVAPDGIITTFAGGGFSGANGGRAVEAQIGSPVASAVGPDGTVYIATAQYIHAVRPDGFIRTFAGDGFSGYFGDGNPATAAAVNQPQGLAVAADSTVYICDYLNQRIRRVGPDGIITTVAGNGIADFAGDGGPAPAAEIQSARGIAIGPDGTLYIADSNNNRVRRMLSPLPDNATLEDIVVASEDGRELHVFNSTGRHLRTLDSLTGALRYSFGYDPAGYLTSVADASGNVATVERSGAAPIAIVAPGGQRTSLTTNGDGWLVGTSNPAREAFAMSYSADGLMQTFTDPAGNLHQFTYDPLGRLVKDQDPAGGSSTLTRTEQANGYTITTVSALGRARIYQVERLPIGSVRRSATEASGARTVAVISPDGSKETTSADGAVVTVRYGPDPRFGMQAPRLSTRVRTLPGGQRETVAATRAVSLSDPTDLQSLQSLTDTLTVNGRAFIRQYDAASRTITDTTAEGRQIVSTLDVQGRFVRQERAPGVLPVTVSYDTAGRVIETSQGTQGWTYTWDAGNRVVTRTDGAGRSVGFDYDAADRIVRKTLPSGAAYRFTYDANGNRTAVILPSGARHALGYTAVDLDSTYTPPGNPSYVRAFNADRQLTTTTLPTGVSTGRAYDGAGRIASIQSPQTATTFEYAAGDLTDRVARIANAAGGAAQDIAYTYNGRLISSMETSGAASAQVTYTYGDDFLPDSMSLRSGTDTLESSLARDGDGLVSSFGPFTFARGGPRGAVSALSDASSVTSSGYDSLGRISTRNHQIGGGSIWAMQLSYDAAGRIIGKSETSAGATHAYGYAYDLDGHLASVTRDSAAIEAYAYDVNGNRISRQPAGGTVEAATYDDQDRLVQRGAVGYQYDADGFLTQRGADTFQYDRRGQLLAVSTAAATIVYAYDGLGRRASRTTVAGTEQYLYGDPASHLITAIRAPGGELTSLFYDTAGLLIALDRGGIRYYVATDQVGSPRAVSSAAAVIKTLEYDSFGVLIADSNPAFDLPIGYAGGLSDPATGLVHFGFRDYDAASGRWTARDPALFGGGQGNLYVYVGNNPVSQRDPLGLFCVNVTAYDGVGGGVGFCITDEGASVCGEAGFGVGVGVGADLGGGLEKTGTQLVGELSYAVGPVEVGVGGSLDSSGCAKLSPKAQAGPITAELNRGFDLDKAGLDLDVHHAPKIGAGAEAKVAAKGCIQGKF